MEDVLASSGPPRRAVSTSSGGGAAGGASAGAPSSAGPSGADAANASGVVDPPSAINTVALPPKPQFPALSGKALPRGRASFRKIPVPPHRYSPLQAQWMSIYEPLVQQLKLQVRMNTRSRTVELKTSPYTEDAGALQKGADFVRGFILGFSIADAIALIRLDDLYLETFEVGDVRMLKGDHQSRAIGRIAGKDGRTKYAIENATKTRLVVADTKIHILGSFANIRLARNAVVSLILGAPPGKVYNKLKNVAARLNERF